MIDKIYLDQIRNTAESFYREGDFYCSEAVIKTLIDAFQIHISDDVIKMASGFPVGIGGMGCTCGAISGGVMFIGLIFGRKIAKDTAVNNAMELSSELYNKFIKAHKVSCCKSLTKGMIKGSDAHMKQCVSFTGEVAYETAKIVATELQITMT